jgi:hypothetical protein
MAKLQLSKRQLDHFDQKGFLVLRADEHHLIDPTTLKQWANEVQALPREKGKWMPYDEITSTGERMLMRTEHFVDFRSGFSSLLNGNALTGILAQLTRDDMLLFKEKINYKMPGGSGFAAHLDALAYDHMGEIEHTTANLAVDAATLANGCVEVVPGSHKMEVELSRGGSISEAWEAKNERIPVELAPGDLLMFGSHLAHRSGPNKTDTQRASVYATYHMASDDKDSRSRYYADRRENFPPDHVKSTAILAEYVECLLTALQSVYRARTMALV